MLPKLNYSYDTVVWVPCGVDKNATWRNMVDWCHSRNIEYDIKDVQVKYKGRNSWPLSIPNEKDRFFFRLAHGDTTNS